MWIYISLAQVRLAVGYTSINTHEQAIAVQINDESLV
jgi:hypothetical protein